MEKAVSLTDSPRVRKGLITLSALFMLGATYAALMVAPDAVGEPVTYRIIYFHVPSAIMSYLGFFIVFLASIVYLWKKDLRFDRWAVSGAELGILFCSLVVATGMIWGKQRWGTWWLWEPRLTTALVLLIIFIGYRLLRGVVENDDTRARYAAVYGIIGFLDVPIVHFSIKMWGSIMHPAVIKSTKAPGMTPEMIMVLKFTLFAFLVTFATLFLLRLRMENVRAEVERLRSQRADN